MPGELWRETVQIGKETVYGTAVPATRKIYGMDVSVTRERESRPYQFTTGGRDNVRGMTLGPVSAGGSIRIPMSADEIIEWLLIGIKGAVVPSTPAGGVYLWTFTPGNTLDSATIRRDDGSGNVRVMSGVYVDQITIAGSTAAEHNFTATLFGADVVAGTLTGALSDRTPTYMEGWQTNFYLDAFAGTPGTTQVVGSLVNWSVSIGNGLGRKYTAANTLAASAITFAPLTITAQVTIEASQAQAATEFTNWDAVTKRLMRLEFLGPANELAATYRRFVTIDLPLAWSAYDLNQSDANTRTYQLTGQYIYDATNAFGIQIRAQNARATAW